MRRQLPRDVTGVIRVYLLEFYDEDLCALIHIVSCRLGDEQPCRSRREEVLSVVLELERRGALRLFPGWLDSSRHGKANDVPEVELSVAYFSALMSWSESSGGWYWSKDVAVWVELVDDDEAWGIRR